MDSDFHYYGTGTAGLAAGFDLSDAVAIANAAQYVDCFDSDYWSNWRLVDRNGQPVNDSAGNQYRYRYPQLSIQKIDWKMSTDYDIDVWNSFHFPPGNLPYEVAASDWTKLFRDQHVVRNTNLTMVDSNKLCRPYSKFALDMVQDTIRRFGELQSSGRSQLASVVADWVAPRLRCPPTDGRRLALYLLGLRAHVLSDTWAHQDFTGERNKKINGAGIRNDVHAKDTNGTYQLAAWTGTVWALHDDTDCAAAPAPGTDLTAAGHGQLGHYPDYSWLTFQYPAAWLPQRTSYHVRDNPKEYREAWSWVSFVMALCSGQRSNNDVPSQVPQEISDVMNTWHALSRSRLAAVPASEQLWKRTALGGQIPDRWDTTDRKSLGLYEGLAWTRMGHINVIQDSSLHYMELAAAIHYQFCVKWLQENPDYTWRPRTPRT